MRARSSARVAPGALLQVNDMPAIGCHRDGFDRAPLGANRAAGAVIEDAIFDEGGAFAGGTATFQVRFVFLAKVSEGRQDGIGRGFAKATEAAGTYLAGQLLQMSKVLALTFADA